jgi:transposase
MWDILPRTLYHWYRNHLSDYHPDKLCGRWPPLSIQTVDHETGEVLQEQPVYVLKPENIGQKMNIDDKAIGRDGYTVFSNAQTGKIAMLIESIKEKELAKVLSFFGNDLLKIKSVCCDMSPTYLKLCTEQMPYAKTVVDKFHVMRYVYDAVLDVHSTLKKELAQALSKGKQKTEQDKEILYDLALLRRCRNRLTQSSDKWSEPVREQIMLIFSKYRKLKIAYDLSQHFRAWYHVNSHINNQTQIKDKLTQWYHKVKESEIEEFYHVAKMIRKHEREILNYFIFGHTNANAESLNGKIQRFVATNYGLRDKDFALYRIAGYFS